MEIENKKCVMILDEALPLGILANTAGILGITLGRHLPETIGPDVCDKSGREHLGIIAIPVPILKAGQERIRAIRQRLYQPEFADVVTVDFSNVAQSCNVYDEYQAHAAATEENDFSYFGLGLCGPKKLINQLSGNLPLLR